jgi:hypothetical protein
LEAVEKYADTKCVLRSQLFARLQEWRQYAQRNRDSVPRFDFLDALNADSGNVEKFKNAIMYAVFNGDVEFIDALRDAVTMTHAPDPDMDAVRAMIAAFCDLFKGDDVKNWPDKPKVRAAATNILNRAHKSVPDSDRQWTRIFAEAGLSDLLQSR